MTVFTHNPRQRILGPTDRIGDGMDAVRPGPSWPSRGITPSLEGGGGATLGAATVCGFTLIEMVVVIVLLGIVGSIVAVFIVRPVEGYRDLARRAALVEAAESALRRMQRDIRTALPNSVRVTNTASGFALELVPVLDAGRYNESGGTNDEQLDVTPGGGGDDQFDIQHCFRNPATKTTPGIRLVINNQGTGLYNVYNDAGSSVGTESIITPATGMTISITSATCPASGFDHITMTPGHDFRNTQSPNRRVYVVTTALSYLCDTTAGTLTRYYGYSITATQPTVSASFTALNASSALVADHVTACSVTTTTSDVRNRAIATLTLTLAEEDEQIRLVQQAQMDNTR